MSPFNFTAIPPRFIFYHLSNGAELTFLGPQAYQLILAHGVSGSDLKSITFKLITQNSSLETYNSLRNCSLVTDCQTTSGNKPLPWLLDLMSQISAVSNMDQWFLLLTLIPAWISNHMPSKVLGEITYPFPNFNRATVAVWDWILSNIIPLIIMDVITYPWWD